MTETGPIGPVSFCVISPSLMRAETVPRYHETQVSHGTSPSRASEQVGLRTDAGQARRRL